MAEQPSAQAGDSDPSLIAHESNFRRLDDVDRTMLAVLRADGRITNRALADRVGMTAPAALRRRRRLESEGVIRRYTVDVAGTEMGLVAYVGIRVSEHTTGVLAELERRLGALPSVRDACQVTGQFDYLLRVEVADLTAYRRFHSRELAALSGVAAVTTFVVIEELDVSG